MTTIQKKVSRGHTYWQIVESRRINGKPRPIVLMHLGTAETLIKRIKEGSNKPVTARVMQFGAIAALWAIAERLNVVEIIDHHIPKRAQGLSCGQYLLLAAINRCVAASSKASLYEWYRHSVLNRLIPTSKSSLASQRFWDHMSYLSEEKIEAIEEELTRRIIQDFHVDLSTLIFDATNFDTFIDTRTASELAQRGHAKSKRKDLRIIGLALLVSTDFHIPLLSHLYPGNQNDSAMFGSITESLVIRYRRLVSECEDVTLVFDGGNTSKGNMESLDKGPYHFVTSLTLTHHKDLLEIPLKGFNSFKDQRLKGTTAYRTTKPIWGEERTMVITRSEELLSGQVAGIESALRKKRKAFRQLKMKLRESQQPGTRGKGYTRESLQKHLDTITSGQYISQILHAEIIDTEGRLDFQFWTDLHTYSRLKQIRLGKRILCTDKHDWSTEEIIIASRAQYYVEDAFKQMKNPHWVSFSPAFHWTDQKLRFYAFYCVLALLLTSLLQRQVANAGVNLTINAALEQLSGITEVVNLFSPQEKPTKGRYRAEYVLSERSALQHRLCQILDIYKFARH